MIINGIELHDFLIISGALFCIGLFSVLSGHNIIRILIGIELMINAALLNFVAFGALNAKENQGLMFALFAMVLATAAIAVALAIAINVYDRFHTIDPNKINKLKD